MDDEQDRVNSKLFSSICDRIIYEGNPQNRSQQADHSLVFLSETRVPVRWLLYHHSHPVEVFIEPQELLKVIEP